MSERRGEHRHQRPEHYNQPASLDGGGGGGLTKYGLGMLSVTGSNTYTGGTAVSGGTLQLGNSAALGSGGLTVGNSGTVDVNGCVVSLPWLNGVAGAVITDNSMPLSTPAPTVLTVNVLFGVSTYGGSILKGANGQDLGLTETGYGTLILSGSSNYSGGTIISGGTLQIGNGGSGEGLASPIITNNGSLVFNHADALTIAASISGSGCLSKTSDVTPILTGSNTYSGGTTVIAGTLQGNAASLQSSIVNLNNASVVFDQAITGTYGGLMSGSGGLTKIDIGNADLDWQQYLFWRYDRQPGRTPRQRRESPRQYLEQRLGRLRPARSGHLRWLDQRQR